MPEISPLGPDEWRKLRNIRLAALRESPDAFLATYERQKGYTEYRWRVEFDRGCWFAAFDDAGPVCLLGVTRDPRIPADARYLEYVWVAPRQRGHGVALAMLTGILDRLRVAGLRTAFLWVLDGNDAAMRLYKRAGFIRSDHRVPLPGQRDRFEERLHLNLARS